MIRSLFLLLLLPLAVNAQIVIGHGYSDGDIEKAKALVSKDTPTGISVGGSYTTVEIEKAKEVLAASQPKTLKLEVGEFEVIEPAANVTSPLLWIVQDDSICQRIDIKPNQPFGVWMKRRGEQSARYHSFEAKPVGWILLIGVKQGQSITHIVKNGATEKEAPSVIDKLDVTVGTPIPPKPPEPDLSDFEKQLKAAGNADIAAGKGTKAHAEMLAGIYRGAAESPPQAGTIGSLYDTLREAVKAAGIPTPDKSLPTLRKLIEAELNKRLPTDREKVITLEDRNRITAAFNFIANALEAVTK